MAVELLAGGQRPELLAQVSRDIEELDELIDEVLLASRLESTEALQQPVDLDLLAALTQ